MGYSDALPDDFDVNGFTDWANQSYQEINSYTSSELDEEFSIFKLFDPNSNFFFVKIIVRLFSDLFNFLFVPSEERLTAIQNTVTDKFAFINSVNNGIGNVQDMMNNLGNAPKINISIPQSSYTNEMHLDVVDMTWYAPYKHYGDVIITGFVYIAFIWRIYINLSNIINGNAGRIASDIEIISKSRGSD